MPSSDFQQLRSAALLERYPEILIEPLALFFEQLSAQAPKLADSLRGAAVDSPVAALWRGLAASSFVRASVLREPAFAARALANELRLPLIEAADLQALVDELGEHAGLRRYRRRHMLMIAWLDLSGLLTLTETLQALSRLADVCLQYALQSSADWMAERYGTVRDEQTESVVLYAICMGKLGGNELNFSSDIDLIFSYTASGESDGARALDASEYFLRQARRVIDLLDGVTADGRVFRVDTRLRPFGDSGPLAISFGALESYLQEHGRDWERYAFVKARFVGARDYDPAGNAAAVRAFVDSVLTPFVFRRYLDFGVLASLREMKAMIAREVLRRDRQEHLKLGPGGIRELEFIVQAWQLIRGGQQRLMRCRGFHGALQAAVEADCLPADTAAGMRGAYDFLRRLENRLQALEDRQTHELPTAPTQRAALALSMDCDGWAALLRELDGHRRVVSAAFNDLLLVEMSESGNGDHDETDWLALDADGVAAACEAIGLAADDASVDVLNGFLVDWRRVPLERTAEKRLNLFIQRTMQQMADRDDAVRVLPRVLPVASAVLRRSAYLSLLNEQPAALARLIDIAAAGQWVVERIAAHPLLLDELLDSRLSAARLEDGELGAELKRVFAATDANDAESQMQLLVRFAQTAWFHIAVADCTGVLPIMKVSDRLSEVAELVLQKTTEIAWADLTARTGCPEGTSPRQMRFAVIGYGKLGGLELGYGSDLDLVFLHDIGDGETNGPSPIDNQRFVARLARRLVHFLSVQTGDGQLYEIDTRLRPSGRSGFLVSSLQAFARYQREDAWTWEHQALIRARVVAGDSAVGEAFDQIRRDTLTIHVQRDTLLGRVRDMRQKMRDALSRAASGQFDLKQDPGGIADLEFIVQYLVLANAASAPSLLTWSDNIRQLDSLAEAGVISAERAVALQDAYRRLRELNHRLTLNRQPPLVAIDEVAGTRALVSAVWDEIFGE